MRAISYDQSDNVMAYHAFVAPDGGTVEHTGMVALTSIQNGVKPDGSIDAHTLVLICPTCGARALVPLTGTREAQRLHAMVRAARGTNTPYNTAATQSVINDVKALGSVPRILPNDNPLTSR